MTTVNQGAVRLWSLLTRNIDYKSDEQIIPVLQKLFPDLPISSAETEQLGRLKELSQELVPKQPTRETLQDFLTTVKTSFIELFPAEIKITHNGTEHAIQTQPLINALIKLSNSHGNKIDGLANLVNNQPDKIDRLLGCIHSNKAEQDFKQAFNLLSIFSFAKNILNTSF